MYVCIYMCVCVCVCVCLDSWKVVMLLKLHYSVLQSWLINRLIIRKQLLDFAGI